MDNLHNQTSHRTNHIARRLKAYICSTGTTQLHLHNPYIAAWWSAAFPGFGHLLLNKQLRGFMLFIWEVFINVKSNLNLAMVYSFCGNIEMSKEVLDTRWIFMYIPVYIFAIWDSYRTAVNMNNLTLLAEREGAPIKTYHIGALEINYLVRKSPIMAVFWSIFLPGIGQLYINRLINAAFSLVWSIIFLYNSRFLEAFYYLFQGEIVLATDVLNVQWLLFIPSIWGFSLYDAYVNAVENNKLFVFEQKHYLKSTYQSKSFQLTKRSGVTS